MEMSWVVRGAYANWSMTLSILPPDDVDCDECVEDWHTAPLTRVYAHFADVVNLLEAGRELDDARMTASGHALR